MTIDPTTRAWLTLLLLSGASVLAAILAGASVSASTIGVFVLVFAWMKARVILSRYLGLWQAPSWLAGFNWALGLYSLLLLVLFLIPAFTV
ncbi:MAG: nitric oxide reductase F protein [Pseudomonadota bacterium]